TPIRSTAICRHRDPDAWADDGRERPAIDGEQVEPCAAADPHHIAALIALAVRREFGLRVVAEDVARYVGDRRLRADDRGARGVRVYLDAAFRAKPVPDAELRRDAPHVREMRPHPGAARDPRQLRRDRRTHLGGEIALAGVGACAPLARVHLERLEDLPPIVAFTATAPAEWNVVAVDRPCPRDVDSRVDGRSPARFAGEMQVVVLVLLAIAVGMPIARRYSAAKLVGAVGRRDVAAAQQSRVVAK